MKSIYFKNFIVSASMVMFSFLVLAVAFVFLGRGFLMSEKREGLESVADEVVKTTTSVYINGDLEELRLRISFSTISAITGNDIFMCNTNGDILNCSDQPGQCRHQEMRLPPAVIDAMFGEVEYYHLTDLGGIFSEPRYVVSRPMISPLDMTVVGFVVVSAGSDILMGAWRAFILIFAATASLIILFAVLMSFFLSKQQAAPVNEMAAAARRFAHGDFTVRVKDEGRLDEIGELTASFNAMAESLENAEDLRSEFIANISHELKTPMTTISGFADGILDGTIPPENQEKYLKTISDETKRLSRLVRKMLDISRISAADTEVLREREFDISETLRRTILVFEKKITDKGLDVDAQVPENSIIVFGDEDAITQVVYNLLDNSIKFAHAGTSIGICLWRQEGKAFVSIKNTGEVISPAELPLIFDRFHKTDRSRSRDREGMGLGLYIVKSILGSHEEDIVVTSKDSETEFVFTLTLKPEKKSAAEKASIDKEEVLPAQVGELPPKS